MNVNGQIRNEMTLRSETTKTCKRIEEGNASFDVILGYVYALEPGHISFGLRGGDSPA